MEPSNFEAWLTGVAQLSSLQRKIVFRVLALAEAADPSEEEAPSSPPVEKPTEKGLASRDGKNSGAAVVVQESRHNCDLFNQIARQRIARSGCPHCGSAEIRLWGRANGLPRYRCSACRKTFNPFTATPVAGLHKKDRWLDQACALIEGETLAKAAERCRNRPQHGLPMAASLSGGSRFRQAEAAFGHCRGRRDLHSGVVQRSARRAAEAGAQTGRQSCEAGPLGRANSCNRRSRSQRRHVRRRSPPPRRCEFEGGSR